MRQAGTIESEADAQRFAEYLLTIDIATRVIQEASGHSVWVRDETQIDRAKAELAEFLANRTGPKYVAAAPLAREIKKVESAREQRARRNVVDMREHWRRPALRQTPLLMLLIFASIAVTLYTSFGQVTPQEDAGRAVFLDAIRIASAYEPPSLDAVAHGEVWRLVSPIFLHYHLLHLLFNMTLLHRLGSAVENIDGTWRFALLVVVLAVTSNVAQFYVPKIEALLFSAPSGITITPNQFAGGMSGVVYGLFGYIWIRARHDPLSRYAMDDQTVIMLLVWFFICLVGIIENVANTAHGVGLLVGMAIGYATAKYQLYRLRN